ncbi:MAG: AI-2E family transporter [Myxococcota bacterium]|jgi:predicted PurR-regulated permease PerM|nr:AI-2E family transporter [Myxococcota bacterium]
MIKVNIGLNRTLAGLVLVALLVWLVASLQTILFELLLALGIAYILDPVVDRLERLVKSRALGILLLMIPLVTSLVLVSVFVIPSLVEQVWAFLSTLPAKLTTAFLWAKELAETTLRFRVPKNFADLVARYGGDIKTAVPQVVGAIQAMVPGIASRSMGAVRIATALVLVPIFAVYLLYDFDNIIRWIRDQLPRRYEPAITAAVQEIDRAVAGFFRGQLTVCLILGTLYSIGYSIVGLDLAIVIGLGTGLLAIVPYAGSFTGFLTALTFSFIALASGTGTGWQVFGVILVFALVQTMDALFITPRVLGHSVDLSPVFILIALMVGGSLLGILGVLIAVPAAASVRVLGRMLLRWYRSTRFYQEGFVSEPLLPSFAPAASSPPPPTAEPAAPVASSLSTAVETVAPGAPEQSIVAAPTAHPSPDAPAPPPGASPAKAAPGG